MLITNVSEALLSAREVWVVARVCWQVEILFRVWKRGFRVDTCRSRNLRRVLCKLYAKLMGVVVWHWLLLVYRGGCVGSEFVSGVVCVSAVVFGVVCVCVLVVGLFESCLKTCCGGSIGGVLRLFS